MFRVFKFRTMHPYSEFLQDYMKKHHGYGPNGKIVDDFRVTGWGKFLRKFWIDELPQVINLAKGDMKIVGVRPVSNSYFNDLPKEIQSGRRYAKPGCIPPYLALNRKSSVGSVLEAEEEYMAEFRKAPLRTDVKYFMSAVYHIVFSRRRSA
jgi:lipopolysaccharide/colanic/teichoic acid biosynthesis glycosyltransferase